MSNKYKAGQIMKGPPDKELTKNKCCLHKRLTPLEVGFASKTYPEGYNEPYYSFSVGIIEANVVRVRSYLCLTCGKEIKAPDPGMVDKDRL